jgi:MoxR-like ATPase
MDRPDALLADWRARALALEAAVAQVVIGQTEAIRLLNIAVFARGHVLLQGDVGVGKTTVLRAFARVIGGAFARTEGTIDLMPNDLIYYTYISAEGRPAVTAGPLIAHGDALSIFFFNEINRARPQVHALLLRVMAERSVTAFNAEVHLPHLLVFADRNRVEREETFEISMAARDRFMMEITLNTPVDDASRRALVFDTRFHDTHRLLDHLPAAMLSHRELNDVAAHVQTGVAASEALMRYVLKLWQATATPAQFGVRLNIGAEDEAAVDNNDIDMHHLVLAGASPRGMSLLLRAARVAAWLAGRDHVTPEDVQAVFAPCTTHRLCFEPVFEMRRHELAPRLISGILAQVAAP